MIKVPIGVTVGLAALAAAGAFLAGNRYTLDKINSTLGDVNERQQTYSKLSEVDTYVRSRYAGAIDEAVLTESTIEGFVKGLGDEWAEYLTPAEYAARDAALEGERTGLGFEYEREPGGYILITTVDEGGPAEEAGLLAGDVVTAVNNTDVIAFEGGYEEAVTLFDAAEGTRVKLYIKRTAADGKTNFIDYSVIAGKSERVTVSGTSINNTAYIRITGFNRCTAKEIAEKLEEFSTAKAVIFDVRDTHATDMGILTDCLEPLLPAGDKVFAAYKDGSTQAVVTLKDEDALSIPVKVLINGNTDGSGELFALALKEYASAALVGMPTRGRGTLQSEYHCSDGSVVLFSAARLGVGNNTGFEDTGVIPDVHCEQDESILPQGKTLSDISDSDRLLYDTQLLRALEP
ncbi:MAG: PDZ domain-containing protein [Oscillospiraceae bacterium]|nr:PDZ domain-containing protein [Oscillospiraceae bacterium]